MSVVSRPARQKSWQIEAEIVSLIDAMKARESKLGERLRALSAARGLKSDEDAARLVGVSYRQYQRWLSGESPPRVSSLKLIATAFEIPLAELVDEEKPPESQLDRVERKLDGLIELITGAPADELPGPGVVARAGAPLLEVAESRKRKAPAQSQTRQVGARRKRA